MSILDTLKKKYITKKEIIPAHKIIECQDEFQAAQDALIAKTFAEYIPGINDAILLAAKKLKQDAEIFINVPDATDQDIITSRFCKYIREYFNDLGYTASVCRYTCQNSMVKYRIALKWE
jgi:hypothetical protein